MKKLAILAFLLAITLILPFAFYMPSPDALAQEDNNQCAAIIERAVALSLESCGDATRGSVCWASGTMNYEPEEVEITEPGGRIPLSVVNIIEALPTEDDTRSIVRINFPDPGTDGGYTTGFLFGPLTMRPVEGNDWTSFVLEPVETDSNTEENCTSSPPPGLLLQAPENQFTILTINDIRLSISHTAYITLRQNDDKQRTTISVLRGFATAEIGDSVEIAFSGESFNIEAEAEVINPAVSLDTTQVRNLPVQMLPSIVMIPLPGHVSVNQNVGLYAAPDASSTVIETLGRGTQLNLLGQDPTGEWWHVVREDGRTGWVADTALEGTFPFAMDVPEYSATPQPPTRPYGSIWGRGQTNNNYVNLRTDPSTANSPAAQLPPQTGFGILGRDGSGQWVEILLDSPAIDTGATRGWLAVSVVTLPRDLQIGNLPVVPEAAE